MAYKRFTLRDIGTVTVYKHRRAKSIKLRIHADNQVRVTIPSWLPYAAGTTFASSKADWIKQRQPKQSHFLHDSIIGKKYRVVVSYKNDLNVSRTRLKEGIIEVCLPFGKTITESDIQQQIQNIAEKALRVQAKDYLPKRLAELATSHNFDYASVRIKKMTSRWGSCSTNKDISLNIFLMQLEDDLIDYVLLHELLHTKIPSHGKRFWSELDEIVPNLASMRQRMRHEEPRIIPR